MMRRQKAPRPTGHKTRKPHAPFSSGKVRGHDATPSIDIMQALAVFDGQQCLGHILSRGKAGIEAFDQNDKTLGIFSDQRAAADAVSKAASS
jgi:hypothetical protein